MGSRGSFPGLGGDPTPGDKEAVAERLEAAARALQQVDEAAGRLKQALDVSADWKGGAANQFGEQGDDALLGLEAGKKSLAPIGEALNTWLRQMTANQQAADILEADAMEQKTKLAANPSDKEKEQINRDLAKIFALADRLEAKHKREANEAAKAIEGAKSDEAFAPVTITDLQEQLKQVSTVAGEVSKWTATLGTVSAAVPGGQVASGLLLTTAAAAQGVKTLSDTGLIVSGSPDAPKLHNVIIDQAGGVTPIKGLKSGLRGADAIRGAKQGERLKEAGRELRDRAGQHADKYKGQPDLTKSVSEQRREAAAAVAGIPADGVDSYNEVTGSKVDNPFKPVKPVTSVAQGDFDGAVDETAKQTYDKHAKKDE